jgi:hypothetical protein
MPWATRRSGRGKEDFGLTQIYLIQLLSPSPASITLLQWLVWNPTWGQEHPHGYGRYNPHPEDLPGSMERVAAGQGFVTGTLSCFS